MLEKLQKMRFLLSVMTGKMSRAEVEKSMMKEFDIDPTEEMSEGERGQLNEAVEGMVTLGTVVDEIFTAQAIMYKKTYDALTKVGFSPDQAIIITAQSKGITFE